MVITMLISAGVLALVAVGMLAIMSRRQKALPRDFDPPIAPPDSQARTRISGDDD